MKRRRIAGVVCWAVVVLAPPRLAAAQAVDAGPGGDPEIGNAVSRAAQREDGERSVVGWRVGLQVGAYDIRGGGFTSASTGAGAALGLDFIARGGWGVGLSAHASVQDPLGDPYLLGTVHASLRYNNVGRGEHYYQFLGVDGVAGGYRRNRASTVTGVDTTAVGFGLGPVIGFGGFVGGDGIPMEIAVGYTFLWFRDQKVSGTQLPGTSVQTNILRIVIGFWIG